MQRITQTNEFEKQLSSSIDAFFNAFRIRHILKKVGACKAKGIPATDIFRRLFGLVFCHKTLFTALRANDTSEPAKDVFYRFINSVRINWMRFTTLLAALIAKERIVELTDEKRINVFIVDDTPYERNRSKKAELLSWVHDHAKGAYIKGFRLLTLGWSDGNTFLPVNSCLLSSSEKGNGRISEAREIDKRTCGYRQRQLAQGTAPAAMMEMLRLAIETGLHASYVLFDSWFSSPKAILDVKKEGLDVIAMVKKTSRVHYRYEGKKQSVCAIYKRNKKRRGRSRYLLSTEIEVFGKEGSIPARLVFVRNRNKKKEYLVLISTDMLLSEEEIIRIYGKRWDIEVFFRVCKSYLHLTKECQSLSYDAMTAYVAVVFARYMMLALANRIEKDDRTMGMLFSDLCDELADIKWLEALNLLMRTFASYLSEKLFLDEMEVMRLLDAFMENLPALLQNKLFQSTKVA